MPENDSWRFVDKDAPMDADNPWPFSEFTTDITEERTSGSLDFEINEIDLGTGETMLEFSSPNFREVAGFQFTLEAGVEQINNVEGGLLEVNDSHIGLVNGKMMMSWHSDKLVSMGTQVLFTVRVKTNGQAKQLSNAIAVSEAYIGQELEEVDVVLAGAEAVSYALNQNKPNPWKQV